MKSILLLFVTFFISHSVFAEGLIRVQAEDYFDTKNNLIYIETDESQVLVFDSRFNKLYKIGSKNIVIKAENISFESPDNKKVQITAFDTNDRVAPPAPRTRPPGQAGTNNSSNGKDGGDGIQGNQGVTGITGADGKYAGFVDITFRNISADLGVHFLLQGQPGQNGGKGGQGQQGGNGGKGRNRGGDALCTNDVPPGNGGKAGRGGIGGAGGDAGDGGAGGKLSITIVDQEKAIAKEMMQLISYDLNGAEEGDPGDPGKPGRPGKPGERGKGGDCGGGGNSGQQNIEGPSGRKGNVGKKGKTGTLR